MKSLWKEWPRLKRRIGEAPRRLVLLDFDGTLVGIARTPDAVRFRAATRRRLRALVSRKGNAVALISGRSVADLRSFVDVKGVYMIGNHGFEMRGKGLALPAEIRRAAKLRFTMRTLAKKLQSDLSYLPGVLVEDKGMTVSVHYRNVPREQVPALLEVLKFFRQRYRDGQIAWREGKKVWEAVPRIRWNKGFAALYLLRRLRGSLPIAVGDDRTDEDMFRAVRRVGISVRVGRAERSRAEFYLKSQKEVDPLLEELIR
jgi:trehalose-phosphatase